MSDQSHSPTRYLDPKKLRWIIDALPEPIHLTENRISAEAEVRLRCGTTTGLEGLSPMVIVTRRVPATPAARYKELDLMICGRVTADPTGDSQETTEGGQGRGNPIRVQETTKGGLEPESQPPSPRSGSHLTDR